MEQVKKNKKAMTLRKSFILYVLITFVFVIILSAAVIWGCYSVQNWLLPQSNEVFLNIEKTDANGETISSQIRMEIGDNLNTLPLFRDADHAKNYDSDISALSPKRQLLYHGCGVTMVLLPVLFSLSGILFCGFTFYKKKLEAPIGLLMSATDEISAQNLDFEISYPVGDELGRLCDSFEQMRQALQQNHKKMWEMLEERKNLQASVAHDLRNPIAIINGHAEYMQLNLPQGNLDDEKILSIAGNIEQAAKRLTSYTESIRTLNHLEELEVERKQIDFEQLYQDMISDLQMLAEPYDIYIEAKNDIHGKSISLDPQVLYRILENLVSNAVRFAKRKVCLSFISSQNILSVIVTDDGNGFSDKILQAKCKHIISEHSDDTHSGMGLMICRILCQKHGGTLTISNSEAGGAVVKINLAI